MRIPDNKMPNNIKMEESVLSTILHDPKSLSTARDFLEPEDFFLRDHQVIYEVCLFLHEEFGCVDPLILEDRLKNASKKECLNGLLQKSCSPSAIKEHCGSIKEKSRLRKMILTSVDTIKKCQSANGNANQVINAAQDAVLAIGNEAAVETSFSFKDLCQSSFDRYEKLAESKSEITGLSSGYPDVDRITSGFQASDFVVVAARPSMGKTAFASNIAVNMMVPVAIFSLEMSKEQLFDRIMSSESRVNSMRIKNGQFVRKDWKKITNAAEKLSELDIFIDDTPSLSYAEIGRRARRLKRKHDIQAVIVDYLGLAEGDNPKNRVEEISSISRGFKKLAKELRVPVIALSQLNRDCEKRLNKRPMLSDLRDSGAIEQDADLVMFLYRDEVYHKDSEDKGIAELIIAKHRNGPIGIVRMTWIDKITRFESTENNRDIN